MFQRLTEEHFAQFQGPSCGICNPVKRDYSSRLSYRKLYILNALCLFVILLSTQIIKHELILVYLAKLFSVAEFTMCVK